MKKNKRETKLERSLSKRSPGCPSQWRWERLRLGELTAEEGEQMEQHRASCAHCLQKAQEREAFDEAFRERRLFQKLLQAQQEQDEQESSLWLTLRWPKGWHFAVGGVCLLLIVGLPSLGLEEVPKRLSVASVSKRGQVPPHRRSGRTTRQTRLTPKSSQLNVQLVHAHRQPSGKYQKARPTKPGETLYTGDLIQLQYRFSRAWHVMVVGVNTEGKSYPMFATQKQQSKRLSSGKGTIPSGRSWQAPRYQGEERLFVIVSKRPFSWRTLQPLFRQSNDQARRSLRRWKPLAGWRSASFWLKRAHRRSTQPKLRSTTSTRDP